MFSKKKKPTILALKFECFSLSLYRTLYIKKINIVWKWPDHPALLTLNHADMKSNHNMHVHDSNITSNKNYDKKK